MRTEKVAFAAFEFAMIVLMSSAAASWLGHVEIITRDDMSLFQNIVFLIFAFLSLSALRHRARRLALTFSSVLCALLLLTLYAVGWQTPWTIFFLATMLGVLSVILIPEARGNEFAVFLIILILPLLSAESRLLGSIIAQDIEIPFLQVYIVTLTTVGGCIYLRYTTWTKMMEKEFLSKGGEWKELKPVSWQGSLLMLTIIACAMGANALLAEFMTIVSSQISYSFGPPFILPLIITGIVSITIIVTVHAIVERMAKG